MPVGILLTMLAKMISEMPLPTPCSVACSPNHMMSAVPVVSVTIVIRRNPQPGCATTSPKRPPPMSELLSPSRYIATPNDWKALRTIVP